MVAPHCSQAKICYITKHMILLPLGFPKEADDDFDKILMEVHENHDIYFDDPVRDWN